MKLKHFNIKELKTANEAFEMAEDLVSDYYKISSNRWLNSKYDVKTLSDLKKEEITFGPFAQIIRYKGYVGNTALGSQNYDFYKICIQDHSIIKTLKNNPDIQLLHFLLYVTIHELVHIIRFIKFTQNFKASSNEVFKEESRVHAKTHSILSTIRNNNIYPVLNFYKKWLTHNTK